MSEGLSIGWAELFDVLVVALLLWGAFVWLRRARARLAFVGLVIAGLLFLLARQLDFVLTAWILQGFFAAAIIIVVVVFQEDLRRLFEGIAVRGLRRRRDAPPSEVSDILVRTLVRLARGRTGALIVLPGRDPLHRHLEGGVSLEGRVSEPLLLSLFDPGSPGHDGAVLVEGGKVARFALHLPLSVNHQALGAGGTRHAAGLGLAERTDALCVIVSEERGTISVTQGGELRILTDPSELAGELHAFLGTPAAPTARGAAWAAPARYWREGLAALGLAAVLWVLQVPGSGAIEMDHVAAVVVERMPAGYVLEGVDPPEVMVRLSGLRRDFYFGSGREPLVRIDALLVKLGRRTFAVTPESIDSPPGIQVLGVEPDRVRLLVRKEDEAS
jgi:uncharacterized protein (TIGR00159 family)